MVCINAHRRRMANMKDPCDPDMLFGFPVPILLNFFGFLALMVSFWIIYTCVYERFKCFAQNMFFFYVLFCGIHTFFHSHNLYEKFFCSLFVVALFGAHLVYLYNRACRHREWCRFWYNMVWVFVGFAIALQEFWDETTYCHCYYLDLFAACCALYLKEHYIVEGFPEPVACYFFKICEGLLIGGFGKGTMTELLKYFEYLTDPCIKTPVDYMVPID